MSDKIAIVGCTKSKVELDNGEALPASQLYMESDYFSKTWEYGGLVADDRLILSAEHGIVDPEEELEYYQTYIRDLSGEELDELVVGVTEELENRLDGSEEVIVLGGTDYVDVVEHALDDRNVVIKTPLQENVDGGIGRQKSWLKSEITHLQHGSLE